MAEKSILKKGISNFTLIGTAKVSEFTFELGKVSDSGWKYNKMNFLVDCGDDNIIYTQMMGGFYNKPEYSISTFYKDKSDPKGFKPDRKAKKNIAWEDRLEEDVISDVAESEFIKIGILKDLKGKMVIQKFLTPYDAIAFIHENLKDGTKIKVEGNLKYQSYQGNTSVTKEINRIFLANPNDKNKCEFTQTILMDSGSFGRYDKEKSIFPISAYVPEYVSKLDGKKIKNTIAFPQTFEIEVEESKAEAIKNLFLGRLMKKPREGYLDELQIEGLFKEGIDTKKLKIEDLNPDIQALIDVGFADTEKELVKATTGKQRKRMIIRKPVYKNLGIDDATGKATQEQVIERGKYKIDEILFIDDVLSSLNNEQELFTEAVSDTADGDFDLF